MQGPVLTERVSFSQFAFECASNFLPCGRRGVSRSGGNCISAAAAPFSCATMRRLLPAVAALLFVAATASLFGCHPVAAHRTDGIDGKNARIDFLTPNPDVPVLKAEAGKLKAENAAALKTALNL